MRAECGVVLSDACQRMTDGAGHCCSTALRGGCGSSFAAMQAKSGREFSDEKVAFGVGLRGSLRVPRCVGLLDIVVNFGEAAAVGVLSSQVEDFAGVAESRARHAGRL